MKIEAEKEIKEKKNEVKEAEERIIQREKNMDKRDESLQGREKNLDEREKNLLRKQDEIQETKAKMEEIKRQQLEELERISGFTKEQAKETVMKIVEEKMSKEIAAYIKERETEAKLDVDTKAKEMIVNCMQKRRKLTTCTGIRPKDMVITTNVQLNLLIPSTTGSQSNTDVIIQFQKITCALIGTHCLKQVLKNSANWPIIILSC